MSVFRYTARLLHYHSKQLNFKLEKMKIRSIPALDDNYMYLLVDSKTNQAAIVDPVEPDKVLKAVKEEGVNLTTVMTTHHHWDHAGGNNDLVSKVQGLEVYGGDERIGSLTQKVGHDFTFNLGSLSVRCLFTPCHTTGHICYFVEEKDETPVVFTGDTLFVSGCGRFFEGKPSQMYTALVEILSKLPPTTQVFCGHEYTVNNLKFAQFVEPENGNIQKKLNWAIEQRSKNCATIPSTIQEELNCNPFMRVDDSKMQARCKTTNGIETMGFLRNEKDHFKA